MAADGPLVIPQCLWRFGKDPDTGELLTKNGPAPALGVQGETGAEDLRR